MKNDMICSLDYYAEGKEDFYKKFTVKSILVQGKHKKPAPLITIVITTYKRPALLKQALDSALNQKGFDDYQVLVADNEGEDISILTETAKLLADYKDNDKVIYYRHEKSVLYISDFAFRLARSKWICSLHDDDLLAENHLVNMVGAVEKYPEIHYLSCKYAAFDSSLPQRKINNYAKAKKGSYRIVKYPKNYTCMEHYPGWHGALINRKRYISLGGMCNCGFGDVVMVFKFMYHYGIYEFETNHPLYFYRQGSNQLCRDTIDKRIEINLRQYNFYLYNNRKYHKFFLKFWDNVSAYKILDNTKNFCNRYKKKIDLTQMVIKGNMYKDILNNQLRKKTVYKFLDIYMAINKPKIITEGELSV